MSTWLPDFEYYKFIGDNSDKMDESGNGDKYHRSLYKLAYNYLKR